MNCNCTGPLPSMYVRKSDSLKRKNWHYKHKHTALSLALGAEETDITIYPIQFFKDLITAIQNAADVTTLKIYIAAFPHQYNNPLIPNGQQGKLTLIYAPCKESAISDGYNDIDNKYYILDPNKGCTLITFDEAKKWIRDEYRNNLKKRGLLTKIIRGLLNDANADGDTIKLFHSLKEINEFIVEAECQEAAYIGIGFSSYTNTESNPNNTHRDTQLKSFKNRLLVEFTLLDENRTEIDIEACDNFPDRITPINPEKIITDFNNSDICPPLKCDEDPF